MLLTVYKCSTITSINDPDKEILRKHCAKGENAGNQQHFPLFLQCFQSMKLLLLFFSFFS